MTATGAMAAAFERALARDPAGGVETWYRLGGQPVRLRIAGPGLAMRLPRALSHLRLMEAPAGPPALGIDLWDAAETGVARPIQYFRDVFDRSWPFGRAVLASAREGRTIGMQSHQASTVLDLDAGRAVGCVEGFDRLSLFELGKPLQPLLFAWHSDRDTVPVHCGLVAREGRGMLFGGAGGSGKTTTSLLCLQAGFDYLGDDYIGLPPADSGRFQGYSFYNSTWLEPAHGRRFPWLQAHAIAGGPEDDKQLVILSAVEGARLGERADVAALGLPRVAGTRDTRTRRASAAEAVLRLAPSSILQLPFIARHQALERMTELAGAVPAYWLDLGTDFAQIPRAVDALLDGGS